MPFQRDDRVRLTREDDRVPAGSEGIVTGPRATTGKVAVSFSDYGWHEGT